MKEDIRISVLMGIYNCADTLPEAIDSLLAQTYQGFKLILCDDGSTDNTYQVAKEYADKHDNIILIKNEQNIKLAATLNHCLEYADTEYIARMDGDDLSMPTRFEKQIKFLDEHPEYAVVSSPMIYFDETGDWGFGKSNPTPSIETFKRNAPHPHAPAMVRTAVMKEVGGYTDTKRTIRVEDYDLWYKIYKAGYRGFNLSEHLYKMRDDQNAMARRTFQARYNGFVTKKRAMKDLGIKNAFWLALPNLIKYFIPSFAMEILRKNRMKKKNEECLNPNSFE